MSVHTQLPFCPSASQHCRLLPHQQTSLTAAQLLDFRDDCPCPSLGTHVPQGWHQPLLRPALSTACSSTSDTKPRETVTSWGQRGLLCQGNIAKHPKIPQELTYHRVKEPNAALELGPSFTELPKQKPSNGLLFTYAAVISLWRQ